MTTASIYYHPHADDPLMVLIDGEGFTVHPEDYGTAPTLVGAKIRAIDHACRRGGWKVVDGAAIVRQADGRGTIRIEPVALRPGKPGRTPLDADIERTAAEMTATATAYITVRDVAGSDLQRVGVDGKTAALPPKLRPHPVAGSQLMAHRASLAAVDEALATLGYLRESPITYHWDAANWQCTVRLFPADWRDHPTLVRINDAAAEVLQKAAETLGIPADQLASVYIGEAAEHALTKHALWTEPSYIVDHSRIKGWFASGEARLDRSGPISYSRFADQPKGTQ